jgi:hypothetical protein
MAMVSGLDPADWVGAEIAFYGKVSLRLSLWNVFFGWLWEVL